MQNSEVFKKSDDDTQNPSRKEDLEHLPPAELAESILAKEKQIAAIMEEIRQLLEIGD